MTTNMMCLFWEAADEMRKIITCTMMRVKKNAMPLYTLSTNKYDKWGFLPFLEMAKSPICHGKRTL